jgi:hypothetical protein
MLSRIAALAVFIAAFGALPASGQDATRDVKGEVLVVLAKEAEGPVDAKLKSIDALQKPPFNSFKSMELLATHDVTLSEAAPATVQLPNGRSLQIKLVERMADGRHKVSVSINRPDKQDYLPLLTVIASGEPFFVAGQKHAGGTLVIGVKIASKSGKPSK